ncbi:MAG: hypothetical protein FWF98_03335 [Dehalococcoidia bacterium]|nr:hypothetical protein [Dehalococcoidia bacterium]
MKKGALSFLAAGALCMVLLVASCGSGDDPTGTDGQQTTPSSSVPSGSTPNGSAMADVGGPAVGHLEKDLNGDCFGCHKSGTDSKHNGQYRMPMAPSYYSYITKKDYSVAAGAKADHTSYTITQCFDANCHTKP